MFGVGVPNSPDVFNLHTNMYTRVLGQGDRCGWLAMASKETSSEIGVLSSGGFDLWYKGILKSVGLILPPQFGCAFSWIGFLSKDRILGDLQFFGG